MFVNIGNRFFPMCLTDHSAFVRHVKKADSDCRIRLNEDVARVNGRTAKWVRFIQSLQKAKKKSLPSLTATSILGAP